MRYLVRLVTPKGGLVLDPFAGSGSTLVAAVQEGMRFIGIEKEREYIEIAAARTGVTLKREKDFLDQRELFDAMDDLPQED